MILDTIVAHKRKVLEQEAAAIPLSTLKSRIRDLPLTQFIFFNFIKPFLKIYIALAVLMKYEKPVIFAIVASESVCKIRVRFACDSIE